MEARVGGIGWLGEAGWEDCVGCVDEEGSIFKAASAIGVVVQEWGGSSFTKLLSRVRGDYCCANCKSDEIVA